MITKILDSVDGVELVWFLNEMHNSIFHATLLNEKSPNNDELVKVVFHKSLKSEANEILKECGY